MSSYKYIWKFADHKRSDCVGQVDNNTNKDFGYNPAPDIVPVTNNSVLVNQSGILKNTKSGTGGMAPKIKVLDIINDFNWTRSPIDARNDVPQLILREEKILISPMINQIAQNLAITLQKGVRSARRAEQELPEGALKQMLSSGRKFTTDQYQKMRAAPDGSIMKNASVAIDSLASGKSGVMSAYDNLYFVEDTGFKYKLPYLESEYKAITNDFVTEDSTGVGKPLITTPLRSGSKAMANIATSLNLFEPGTFIDQPRFYNFGRSGKTYKCRIPLFNTTNDFQDVINNWQFIYMLIYQNTPNKITRDLMDPPKIYEATIKGVWYNRYTYISSLNVEFLGAQRRMKLQIPFTETDNDGQSQLKYYDFETVIPDAYELSLSVTEIFPETQNMLYSGITEKQNLVQVTRNSPFANSDFRSDTLFSGPGSSGDDTSVSKPWFDERNT